MTNQTFSKSNFILEFVDRTIYLYPLLIGAIILCLSYYHGIGQYGMGFAFALGSISYYILSQKFDLKTSTNFDRTYKNRSLFLILNIVFLISFSLSLIVLHHSIYIRPTLYFFLVTISFFSLFLEIFQAELSNYNYILILKIILVSLSLRMGRFFNYPSIPGSDTHFHLILAKSIIQNGVIPDYSIAEQYSVSCFLQVFEAINGILLNVNLQNILFYSVIFSSTIITSLLLYYIVNKVYNAQIALIAVLYINIVDMVFVQNVTNINPGSIVYCFFLMILYCIIQQKNRSIFSSILVFMIFCMVLSHQLSTFCVFLILSTVLISIFIYENYFTEMLKVDFNSKNLDLHLYSNTLLYFFVIMILCWLQIGPAKGNNFFEHMIYRLTSVITSMINEYSTDSGIIESSYGNLLSSYNFYSNILYNLGSNFLLMLAVIGILIVLSRKHKPLFSFSCICVTIMLLGIIYAGTYIGLGYLFLPHRFLSFLQLFFVIFASYSTYQIYIVTSGKLVKLSLMITVIFLIFFMLTTPYINRGDAIYSTDTVYRDQYTYSELKSLEWSNHFLKNQTLFADPILNPKSLSTVDFLDISTTQILPFNPKSLEINKNILMRRYVVTNPDLKVGGTFGKTSEFDYNELTTEVSEKYSLIYSSNSVEIYQKNN